MTLGLIIGVVAAAYLLFAAFSIGLPERLWLALLPISLERIPDPRPAGMATGSCSRPTSRAPGACRGWPAR